MIIMNIFCERFDFINVPFIIVTDVPLRTLRMECLLYDFRIMNCITSLFLSEN